MVGLLPAPIDATGLLAVNTKEWRNNSEIKRIIEEFPIVEKMIQQESSGRPWVMNTESGARGLMQITPLTALGGVDGAGNKTYAHGMNETLSLQELYDPVKNVKFGSKYFNALKKSFGTDRSALIAYNWGPGNYKKWKKGGTYEVSDGKGGTVKKTYTGGVFKELPGETQKYLTDILGSKTKTFFGAVPYSRPPRKPEPPVNVF